MKISIEFKGVEETRKRMETAATEAEISAVDKRIYSRSADITEPRMKAHMPKSADNSTSGRTGYRPPGHAADNIPKNVTSKKQKLDGN